MKMLRAASLAALLIAACGSDGDTGAGGDGAGACSSLCKDGGFAEGAAASYAMNVTECMCTGGPGELTEAACDGYCGDLSVPAEHALLSSEATTNDKCVCDGTSLPGDGSGDDGSSGVDDGSANDGSDDGSTVGDGDDGATDGDDGGQSGVFEVDGEGFPTLPADPFANNATGVMYVVVTDSDIEYLPNGQYVSPHSPNASSGSTVSFLDPGFVFSQEPVLQVQLNLRSDKMSGTWMCDSISDGLLRYGNPPSGANQSLLTACSATYEYDATNNSYTGTLEADAGAMFVDETTAGQTGKLKARFAFIGQD